MSDVLASATRPELLAASVSLRFGPARLRYSAADPHTRLQLWGPLLRFVDSGDERIACEVRVHRGTPQPWGSMRDLAEGELWRSWSRPDGSEQVCYAGRPHGGDWIVSDEIVFSPDRRRADVTRFPIAMDRDLVWLSYPIDEYLVCRVLRAQGVLVLHACCVVVDGLAYVFLGHSGAGKSTIAEQCERAGALVLSDDRTIVELTGDGAVAWGTPWHGSFSRGEPSGAPVAALFVLQQAAVDMVTPLSLSTATAETFVRLVDPSTQPAEVAGSLDLVIELLERVPIGSLHFRPTPAVLATARDWVAAQPQRRLLDTVGGRP